MKLMVLLWVTGSKSPYPMVIKQGNMLKLHRSDSDELVWSHFEYPKSTMCDKNVIGQTECYQEI